MNDIGEPALEVALIRSGESDPWVTIDLRAGSPMSAGKGTGT